MAEPQSRCGACGQTDDHPKHQILIGFNNEHTQGGVFHPHDHAREGVVYYHFDCPSPWHEAVTNPIPHEDEGARAEQAKTADAHSRIMALARSGVHGDDLRARILGGQF